MWWNVLGLVRLTVGPASSELLPNLMRVVLSLSAAELGRWVFVSGP